MQIRVPTDARGVVRHRVDHLPVGLAEVIVVLEEVAMPVDVGHHELLIDELIALEQIGVTGVGVDHELVDLRQPVGIALGELLELHPELPVRIPGREPAIGRDFVHLVVADDLEDRLEEVEPLVPGDLLNLDLPGPQLRRQASDVQVLDHRPAPRNSLMDLTIASLSLISETTTAQSAAAVLKFSRMSLMN